MFKGRQEQPGAAGAEESLSLAETIPEGYSKATMKRTILLLLAVLLSGGALFSQSEEFSHPAVPGVYRQEFSPELGKTVELLREEAWTAQGLFYVREIRFNPQGLIESEVFYNADGTPGSAVLYVYDHQARLSRREFRHPNTRAPDTETYVWHQEDPRRLVSASRIYTTGAYGWRFEYFYDEAGRLFRINKIDRYWKDVNVWEKDLSYDNRGRITMAESRGMDSNIAWRDEYYYTDAGEIRETRRYDVNGALSTRTVFSREDGSAGEVTRETDYDGENRKRGEILYYYRRDGRGNWTEKYQGTSSRRGGAEYFLPAGWYLRTYIYR